MEQDTNTNQQRWDARFLEMAKVVASWSKDPSTKVGAVIVRPDKTVCSVGFNGFPRFVDDSPGQYADRNIKYPQVKHAEENAILFAREHLAGYTLYVYPLRTCCPCSGDVIQAGIKRVVVGLDEIGHERCILHPDPAFNFQFVDRNFAAAGIEETIYLPGEF